MYYLMILVAVVLLALQFCTNKFYQLRFGNAMTTSLLFTALSGLTTALLFFCIGGFRLSVTPYSLLIEVGTDVNTLEEATHSARLLGDCMAMLIKEYKI